MSARREPLSTGVRWALAVGPPIAALMAAYQIYVAIFGAPPAYLFRVVHLLFALVVLFLTGGRKRSGGASRLIHLALALLSIASLSYLMASYEAIITRYPYVSPLSAADMLVGIVLALLTLDATRRYLGPALPLVLLAFLAYAFVGPWLPGMLQHPSISVMQLIDQEVFTTEGIFGIPLDASATYIAIFIVLGAFLERSGAGQFYIDLATKLTGKSAGAPAKIAVISSALMGTVTGSPVSNVITTGTFTIPLMKKMGFHPSFAGAVEACASTGSMIMPPVMGAAAFILAAYIGVPYSTVALASIIPAVLYYLGVYAMVDLESRRRKMAGIDPSHMRRWLHLLKDAYLFVPVVVLAIVLIQGFTVGRAAVIALAVLVPLSWVRRESRMDHRRLYGALSAGGEQAASIAVTTACAGLVVGIVTLTGLAVKVSTILTGLAQGNLAAALVMAAIAAVILGMGLPPTAVYVIEAAVVVPGLIKMGVPQLPAHLFVFYFSQFSAITPPVALAAFAAAGIAGASFARTGAVAVRIGFAAFLVPFLFVYRPALLMTEISWRTAWDVGVAAVAVTALAAGFQGWGLRRLGWRGRALLLAASVFLIEPGFWTDAIGLGVLAIAVVAHLLASRRRERGVGEAGALPDESRA